jgi:topoisomerase IA-like protein
MEQDLDLVAKGEKSWKTLLQSSWDLYKERYEEHINTVIDPESKKASNTNQKRDLGEGIVVVLSRKGPLLLKEDTKDFASLPQGSSYETVTLEQAKKAYALKDGINMGLYMDSPLLKKKGPYGFYVQWSTVNVPCKPDDTTDTIIEKIKQKQNQNLPILDNDGNQIEKEKPYERKLGDYTIKKGPYGLYFFKHTLKKASFVSFPKDLDPDKVTAQEIPQIYQLAVSAKINAKKFVSKNK